MRLPGPGPAAERSPRPWTRADFLAATLLLLGTLVSLRWLVHPWFDRTPDGSMYLITVRSLIEGYGHT
ncbi:MAG: hypothetical protein HKN12_03590, partial [Gemmatimonadetes bacterium]|nr:hypothetical protein [Gemmatimonadota bacterium]